jgi:hypothetical protein
MGQAASIGGYLSTFGRRADPDYVPPVPAYARVAGQEDQVGDLLLERSND